MTPDHRLPHRLTLLCLAAALAACGGGGGGGGTDAPPPVGSPVPPPPPPPPPAAAATVEFLSSVVQPTPADAALYTVSNPATRELTYTGTAAPAVGSVVVVGGTAYKIASRTEPAAGRFVFATTTPGFEEVFERLRVNVEVALTNPAPAATVGRITPPGLAETIALASPAGSTSTLTGTIRNALATVDIDYTRAGGLARAAMSVRGELAASGSLVATAGATPTVVTLSAAAPISVAVPSSAGTLAFSMPIDLIVRNDSRVASKLTDWQGRWQFVTGATYNPTSQAFENQSTVTDAVAPTITREARLAVASALDAGVGNRLIASATAVSSVTVAPQIRAQLSAMNDSVGVLTVRQQIGLAGTLSVSNTFPQMIDCATLPVALQQRTYALRNYKAVESVIDLEGAAGVSAWRVQNASTPVSTAGFGGSCTVVPENITVNVNNSWKTIEPKLGQTEPDTRAGSITELSMAADTLLGRGRLIPGTVLNIQAIGAYTFTQGAIEQRFDASGLFRDASGNAIAAGAGSTVAAATRTRQCEPANVGDPFDNDFVMPSNAGAASAEWKVVVPPGAVRLQLSVDDCVFYDNQSVPANPVRLIIRPSAS